MSEFGDRITKAYAAEGPAIDLGRGVLDGETDTAAKVQIPLAMMNRHGLVTGATGTGKTRTLQVLFVAGEAFANDFAFEGTSLFESEVFVILSKTSLALLVHHQYESDPHSQLILP